MQKNKVGQPTAFTEEVKEKILYGVSKGAPYTLACAAAGIHERTLHGWRDKMRTGEPAYVQFFHDLKEAKGKACLHWLDKIDNAIDEGTWTAAAWKLERRQHKYFGKNIDVMDLAKKIDKLEQKLKDKK